MGLRHNYQSPSANDGSKEISSTRWNEDHVISTSLNFPPQASDPATPADGDVWTTTGGALKARLGGATVSLPIATTLTGDVTGSGTGSVATALATVNASPGTFGAAGSTLSATVNGKGLLTSVSALAISITASQINDSGNTGRLLLQAATAGGARTILGLGALATLGTVDLSTLATGTLQAAQEPAHTGDVTNAAGSLALTIAAGAVSLSKMANLTASTILGNNTGSPATPIALTSAQVTAMLSVFGAAAQGVVPASGGGTANFLRADGTWAAPSGGGAPGGTSGQIQFNNAGAFGGFTMSGDATITTGGALTIANNAVGTLKLVASSVTNAKLANMADQTIKGNVSGAAAAPSDLTAAQVKTMLAISTADVSGLGALATASSVSLTTQATGTLQAGQMPALTGDVTTAGGALATTIAANAVTNAKAAQMPAGTIKGNNGGATANAADLTATQATAMLDAFTSGAKGLAPASGGGTVNFLRADGTWAAPPTGGVSDGDKGDVIVSGAGTVWALDYTAVNATIAPVFANLTSKPTTVSGYGITDAVTLAGNQTVAGNKSLTGVTALTSMSFGLQSIATAAGTTTLTVSSPYQTVFTGTLTQTIVLPNATTLAVGHRFKISNNSTGAVTVQTNGGATLWIIAGASTDLDLVLLDNSTAAGSWERDYRVGSSASGKSSVFNNSLTFNGTDGTALTFPTTSATIARTDAAQSFTGVQTFLSEVANPGTTTDPASPASGTEWFDSQIHATKVNIAGRVRDLIADLANSGSMILKAIAGGTTFTALGTAAPTFTGTATAAALAVTNRHSRAPRVEALVTVAATTAVAGIRGAASQVTIGGASSDLGGFKASIVWGPATGVATTTNRGFAGMSAAAVPTDVEPSTHLNNVGMGWDAADTNIQMMFNDASGTATKVDLGASFPVPTTDRTAMYKIEMYSPKGTTQSVQWRVTDMVSAAVAQGTATTKLPLNSVMLHPRCWMSVGGTSSVIGVALMSFYVDPLL